MNILYASPVWPAPGSLRLPLSPLFPCCFLFLSSEPSDCFTGSVGALSLPPWGGESWWWWWWWPSPFSIRTSFSTAMNIIIPVNTYRPTNISALWSWPCSCPLSVAWCPWEWPWPPWEWPWKPCPSLPWAWSWGWSAWGIKCRNASPNNPPAAKLRSTLRRDECSCALRRGMMNKMKNGAALMTAVDNNEYIHIVWLSMVCSLWECSWWSEANKWSSHHITKATYPLPNMQEHASHVH